jgi:hypothetical protein
MLTGYEDGSTTGADLRHKIQLLDAQERVTVKDRTPTGMTRSRPYTEWFRTRMAVAAAANGHSEHLVAKE